MMHIIFNLSLPITQKLLNNFYFLFFFLFLLTTISEDLTGIWELVWERYRNLIIWFFSFQFNPQQQNLEALICSSQTMKAGYGKAPIRGCSSSCYCLIRWDSSTWIAFVGCFVWWESHNRAGSLDRLLLANLISSNAAICCYARTETPSFSTRTWELLLTIFFTSARICDRIAAHGFRFPGYSHHRYASVSRWSPLVSGYYCLVSVEDRGY